MRFSAESILEMSLRWRSRVRSSMPQSVSLEARSFASGSCIGPLPSELSVARDSSRMSAFQRSSLARK
jgi:hypothetical protein